MKKAHKTKRARKPKFGEPLVPYSVMLRKDQEEYLKEKQNASDWVREAIDQRIEAEGGATQAVDVVAISKRITFLEQRIQQLKDAKEYREAFNLRCIFDPKRYEELRSRVLTAKKLELKMYGIYADDYCITTIDEREKKSLGENPEQSKLAELALNEIERIEERGFFAIKVIEGYEKRIAELEAEIQKLKEKITQ